MKEKSFFRVIKHEGTFSVGPEHIEEPSSFFSVEGLHNRRLGMCLPSRLGSLSLLVVLSLCCLLSTLMGRALLCSYLT